jgi:hypothetical protein
MTKLRASSAAVLSAALLQFIGYASAQAESLVATHEPGKNVQETRIFRVGREFNSALGGRALLEGKLRAIGKELPSDSTVHLDGASLCLLVTSEPAVIEAVSKVITPGVPENLSVTAKLLMRRSDGDKGQVLASKTVIARSGYVVELQLPGIDPEMPLPLMLRLEPVLDVDALALEVNYEVRQMGPPREVARESNLVSASGIFTLSKPFEVLNRGLSDGRSIAVRVMIDHDKTEPLTPPNAVPVGAREKPTSSPGQRR